MLPTDGQDQELFRLSLVENSIARWL